MRVNILGAPYKIVVKNYSDEEAFKRRSIDGFCDNLQKEIVLCDMATYKGWEHEPPEYIARAQKQTLRHEIVHAFLAESGLEASAASPANGWAEFEEMVDWIAIQGPKIHAAWVEADAL